MGKVISHNGVKLDAHGLKTLQKRYESFYAKPRQKTFSGKTSVKDQGGENAGKKR